jgi:hypothetical protein
MKMIRVRSGFSAAAVIGCLALAAGCAEDDTNSDATGGSSSVGGASGKGGSGGAGATPATSARVRVLHLSPDAPFVDVFVNQGTDPVIENLEFPKGTAYLEVPTGTYTFDVAPAGGSADDAVLSIAGLTLEPGLSYTAVAIDEVSSIAALPLVDDYRALATGKIRVRAVHAAPAVGEVDLWSVPDSGDPAPLWTNVNFGVAGAPLDVDAGAYTIGVDVDDDMSPDLLFRLPALPAGTVANVYAVNDSDDDVFLLAQLPDGSTARVDPE